LYIVYAHFLIIFELLLIPNVESNSSYLYLASVNWEGILNKWHALVLNVEEMA
jgi:hypothetical protein